MAASNFDSIWKHISKYQFIYETDENVTCVICKGLLIDACQSHCGCQFCYSCIRDYIGKDRKYCPGQTLYCNVEHLVMERNVQRSPMLNRKLALLKVKCPIDSCGSDIQLNEMDNHLRVCSKQPMECPFAAIGCSTETLDKEAVKIHLHIDPLHHTILLMESIQDMKNEINGLKDVIYNSKLENTSLKNQLMEVKGDWKMKMDEQRVEIDILSISVNELIGEVGEKKKGDILFDETRWVDLRKVIDMKINEEITKIVNVAEQTGNIKKRSKSVRVLSSEMREKYENSEVDMTSPKEVSHINEWIPKRIRFLEENLTKVRHEMQLKATAGENTTTIVDALRNDFYKLREKMNICNNERDRRINNLAQICPSIDADYVWRIDDCSKHMNKIMWSEPFYANNYKLCLCIWIGHFDDIGFGCHIMCGDNDDKLQWPMKGVVTLSIIDQYTLRAYKKETYTYETYTNKMAFERPTRDNNDFYIGSPIFLEYSSIKYQASIVVGDSIIVTCVANNS